MDNQLGELRRYLDLVLKWAWFIVLLTMISGLSGFWGSRSQHPIYEASTTLLIEQAPSADSESNYNSVVTSERRARTYAQLLTTEALLSDVIRELQLTTDVESLEQAIDVQSIRDTQLIRVQVQHADPQSAAHIANTLVSLFVEQMQQIEATRFSALKNNLQERMLATEQQIDQLAANLTALGNLPENTVKRDQLNISLTQQRESYASLWQSFEQVRLAEAQTASNVVQVEAAVAADRPTSPQTFFNIALASIAGCVLAIGLIFVRELFDDRVKHYGVLAKQVGLPILGRIPRSQHAATYSIVAEQPRSLEAEAFRALRTNVQFASVRTPLRSILITSPTPSEGKSVVALNLAAVLAQSQYKVLLVDADLRLPTLHTRLNLAAQPGLSELFLDDAALTSHDLDGYIQDTCIPGVSAIAAGTLPPNPAELLGSTRMADLLHQLGDRADLVIIDAPPVTVVTDSVVLAAHVDSVLLVVQHGTTRLEACKQSVEQLQQVAAHIMGLVINNAKLHAHEKIEYRKQHADPWGTLQQYTAQHTTGLSKWMGRKDEMEREVNR